MMGSGANFDSNGNSFTISSAISGGASALSKLGAGTLTLTGTNSYEGITTVQAGTLAISSDDNIGVITNANVVLNDGTTLQANGSTNISAHPLSLFGSVTLDTNGSPFLIGSQISGSGSSITKISAGTLTLNGANNYSGGTTLSADQITVGNNTGLGTGALSMSTGTTLGLSDTVSAMNAISLASSGTATVDVPLRHGDFVWSY